MKTLYVINSPCWTEISPSGLNNSKLYTNPLSENFTYFYYNLMKFGLVNKVKIFVEKHRWRIGELVEKKIDTKYGPMEIFKDDNKFEVINSDKEYNYVFCWSKIEECENIKNKFIIVDNQFHGYIQKSAISDKFHNFVLSESKNFFKYIPNILPKYAYKLISYDHNILKNYSYKKIYDWIMVSSFDKRKRHIEFLKIIKKNNLHNLKGCIIARSPNNKKKILADYFKRNTPWSILNKVKKLKKKINFDLFLNIHQDQKIKLLLESKIFINSSILDSGPRAQVEAMQLNIPVVSLPHIGSSDIINDKNGVIADNIEQIPKMILKMLESYQKYKNISNKDILDPTKFMPDLVKTLQLHYNQKINEI